MSLPARYYGLRAISQRLGVCANTTLKWYQTRELPLVRQPSPKRHAGLGWVYYIDESLISLWYVSLSAKERREYAMRTPRAKRGSYAKQQSTTPTP